jgi:hypothetical protein
VIHTIYDLSLEVYFDVLLLSGNRYDLLLYYTANRARLMVNVSDMDIQLSKEVFSLLTKRLLIAAELVSIRKVITA